MNTKCVLLIVLSATCLSFSACHNYQTEEPNPDRIVKIPDSVYVFMINADSTEILSQLMYFTYDAGGNMTFQFDSIIDPGSYVTKKKTYMLYDAMGNLKEGKASYYSRLYEAWRNERCTLYDYDEQNKLATVTIYDQYTEPLSIPTKKYVYTWIDDAHATGFGYLYNGWDETNLWILSERVEYTYNAKGKVEKVASFAAGDSTEEKPWFATTYEYDKYGNLILKTSINYMPGGDSSTESNKYEYDKDGNILIRWLVHKDSRREFSAKHVYYY